MDKNKGTFLVKILHRQEATWQGSVTWIEQQKTKSFRSALELLKMIDGVLDEDEEIERGAKDAVIEKEKGETDE